MTEEQEDELYEVGLLETTVHEDDEVVDSTVENEVEVEF